MPVERATESRMIDVMRSFRQSIKPACVADIRMRPSSGEVRMDSSPSPDEQDQRIDKLHRKPIQDKGRLTCKSSRDIAVALVLWQRLS